MPFTSSSPDQNGSKQMNPLQFCDYHKGIDCKNEECIQLKKDIEKLSSKDI